MVKSIGSANLFTKDEPKRTAYTGGPSELNELHSNEKKRFDRYRG